MKIHENGTIALLIFLVVVLNETTILNLIFEFHLGVRFTVSA